MHQNLAYLHALNLFPQFGSARLWRLKNHFLNFQKAYEANEKELTGCGIEPELAKKFVEFRGTIDLDKELEILLKEQIIIIDFENQQYPKLLKQISRPPAILYLKGQLYPESVYVAIVGTRKITHYGKIATNFIAGGLAENGVVVVSGLAFGVDEAAHRAALEKNQPTVAVLAGGIDHASIYPSAHQALADEIITRGGAIVSENPPRTPSLKHHFVARNRIVSGMCSATVVSECSLKSGSLITANYALEQDRLLFAVPGQIYNPESKGPNSLLKMGARPATDPEDILLELNLPLKKQNAQAQQLFLSSKEEQIILNCLDFEPKLLDEILKSTSLKADAASRALTFLEMKGLIKNFGGQQYAKISA